MDTVVPQSDGSWVPVGIALAVAVVIAVAALVWARRR